MNIFEPNAEHRLSVTQGDLLQLSNSESAEYGIVVTGECDIAQGKFSNIFSYVELLPATDYAFKFIIIPAIETIYDEIQSLSISRIQQSREFANAEPSIIHHKFFIDKTPSIIQDTELAHFLQGCAQALTEIAAIQSDTLGFPVINGRLQTLSSLAKKLNCKARCPTAQSIYDKLKADPGDLFYIGSIPEREGHYITSLRVLREIHKNFVFTTPSTLRKAPADRLHAKRIARLTAPYRYRLTQKLAAVFSDIGLPGDFEFHRSGSLKSLFPS